MRYTPLVALAAAAQASAAPSSSTLLSGGTIIAFDEASNSLQVIRDGSVLVTGDQITGLYTSARPTAAEGVPADAEVVDCRHKIITPGFVDTHRHGWQTALKTLGSHLTLAEYFFTCSAPAAISLYNAGDVYAGQLAGLLEAVNAGVTTTLDHAHNMWSTDRAEAGLDASIDSGARVIWAPAIQEIEGYQLADQIADWKRWNKRDFPGDRVTLGIAYDGWEMNSPEDTGLVVQLIKDEKPPVLTVHWLGGVWPINSSPSLIHSHGVLNTSSTAVVFSHGPGLTGAEADLLRQTNQFISITPESEMHYGHGHTYAHKILDQAALGVDTHLAFSSDIITQARIWLQRTRSRLFDQVMEKWEIPSKSPMSVTQAFLLATRQGALALRRPDLGVIAIGAKADLVVFDGRSPALLGWADPVAAVILHASVGDIEHVLVDGQFLKRDGRLTHTGYYPSNPTSGEKKEEGDSVVERFLASADRVRRKFLDRPQPDLEKGLFLGAAYAPYGRAEDVKILRGEGTGYGQLYRDTDKKKAENDAPEIKRDEL